MATVQSVIDATISRNMDTDETTWSDAVLLSQLQKAVDYIQSGLISRGDISATKSGTVALSDGTETYLFSANSMTDFIAMYPGAKIEETGVWIDDAFLNPVRITERVNHTSDDESEPTMYYLTDTSIGVLPVPDTTYTLSCRYFYKQPTLVLTDSMPFNDVFNLAIGAFVDSMAAAINEQDISNITALYNELETQAFGVTRLRTPIRPRMNPRLKR